MFGVLNFEIFSKPMFKAKLEPLQIHILPNSLMAMCGQSSPGSSRNRSIALPFNAHPE
jgi:hypothetical protein